MKIVHYESKYKEQLELLFLETRRNTFTWLEPSNFKLEDFEEQTKDEIVLVAVENNTAIGFISLWMEASYIHQLYVSESHQGKQVGQQLLQRVVQEIPGPIRLKCLIKNKRAVSFYLKHKFVLIEKGHSIEGPYLLLERP